MPNFVLSRVGRICLNLNDITETLGKRLDYGARLPMPPRWYLPIFWHDLLKPKFEEAVKVAVKA